MREPVRITSRENPLLAQLRRLAHEPAGYRKTGQAWLEGDHLLRAALTRGRALTQVVLTEAAWADPSLREIAQRAARIAVVSDALMKPLSTLESPAPIAALLALPAEAPAVLAGVPTVVLDRLQDAGNVGSVLRSAAALGIAQVVALSGTAALWSPKVVRAGMGAHFALHLVEQQREEALDALGVPLIATSSHAPRSLAEAPLPDPCAFVFGHEGRGVAASLLTRCAETRRIPQPGGEESLNVAAAAAICLYEAARQRG
ncbi:TrmH family RNA methyltransferase [Caldimonas sp. KR1-144]|uniref:TrmH family RNA methyltransferase n=1 Tax=Caldimonas sp. KR1-144 TaxID=3400911 RepID=UPI003C08F429